jgi:hypothetical protein
MSAETKDGGPAFPSEQGSTPEGTWNQTYSAGMSLRDYFAGQALAGLVSAIPGPGCASWDYYSGAAYHIADAMLAERAKTRGEA